MPSTVLQPDPFQAFGEPPEVVNIASEFRARARETPVADAIRVQKSGARASYGELDALVTRQVHGLVHAGVRRGDRVCLFVRAGVDLIALTFALMELGAVPVLIDPGMGRKNLLACVERMAPRALVAVPAAMLARRLFPRAFRSVEVLVTVNGPRLLWGGHSLARLVRAAPDTASPAAATRADDPAAILFTSGSTGPPKGVAYTHGMFWAQVQALRVLYGLRPGMVDVACFPLFALFDTALGMTSVFPDMDPSAPGRCRPEILCRALEEHRADVTFGSPAIWRRVAPWCAGRAAFTSGPRYPMWAPAPVPREGQRTFPSLKWILIAGAPVPPSLVESLRAALPEGDVATPYGATESLPVASITGAEILASREATENGAGTCVGRVAPGIALSLIRVTDEAIDMWSPELEVPPGEVGEVCVRGPVVTQEYAEQADATHAAKLAHPASAGGGPHWHRMGDLAYRDAEGRLWFCGRKSHRIETAAGRVLPVPAERVYDGHPGVHRTALVGLGASGREEPVLVVELEGGRLPDAEEARTLATSILARGAALANSELVPVCPERVLFHTGFPVDVRHNAKIRREDLKLWAQAHGGSGS